MGSRPYPVTNPHLPLRLQFEHIHPELMVLLSGIYPKRQALRLPKTTHAEDTVYCRGFCLLQVGLHPHVAGSSGNRLSLDLCKISSRSPDSQLLLTSVSRSGFLCQETNALTERPGLDIDDGKSHWTLQTNVILVWSLSYSRFNLLLV